jgi:nicotinate-nucleotide adenylyltransferase
MKAGFQKYVGIFGGAFNPPTKGHLHVMQSILKWNLVDQIWLMPTNIHRYGKQMVPFSERIAMCELSVKGMDSVRVSAFEAAIENKSDGSTYDLMLNLNESYANILFTLIIGQDNADEISKWKNWEKLINQNRFIVLPRPSVQQKTTPSSIGKWYDKHPHIFLSDAPLLPISSTAVRELIPQNDRLKLNQLLQTDVLDYIDAKKIYI